MSADLKKKKGYTTVLLRLSTGSRIKPRSHRSNSRVRFLPERATPESLRASLREMEPAY